MIDQHTEELLSRYLDDDLEGEDRRRLEERLEREPELVEALDGLDRTREAVAGLAAAMEPPAELDALMEPLRRDRGGHRQRRALYVVLSAAACVVIGFTVITEMRRQSPTEPQPPGRPPLVAVGPGAGEGYYQLKPLPTAEPGQPVLGASDRLIASPVPGPAVPEAETLHVYGPLSEDEVGDGDDRRLELRDSASAFTEERTVSEPTEERSRVLASPPAGDAPGPEAMARRSPATAAGARGEIARLAVEVRGTVHGVTEARLGDVPEGRHPVRITVDGGRIHRCRSLAAEPDAHGPTLCAAVAGLALSDLDPGTLDAEVVVSRVR